MTIVEQIEKQLSALPPEKQSQALDFIAFLGQRAANAPPAKQQTLRNHAAFGSWKNRKACAVEYQQDLRAEWGAK